MVQFLDYKTEVERRPTVFPRNRLPFPAATASFSRLFPPRDRRDILIPIFLFHESFTGGGLR
ncbi:MAG: hypothetical protein D6679_06945 [Candidatus Hydrogenedentota bacterium]|nr:MAG: hypothetical protein D6679_06945 [Candidatus Hydrogenedentota bacterium]